MRSSLLLVFLFIAATSSAQVSVDSATISNHVGDSVKYCGKVVTARLMDRMMNAPAFLNIDGAYPHQVFTVVVWKQDRINFQNKPEKFYLDKNVCIYGKLEKFRDQLQIVIHSEDQIVIQQ